MLVNEHVLIIYRSDVFSVEFSWGISTTGIINEWTLAFSYYITISILVNNLKSCGLCLSQTYLWEYSIES